MTWPRHRAGLRRFERYRDVNVERGACFGTAASPKAAFRPLRPGRDPPLRCGASGSGRGPGRPKRFDRFRLAAGNSAFRRAERNARAPSRTATLRRRDRRRPEGAGLHRESLTRSLEISFQRPGAGRGLHRSTVSSNPVRMHAASSLRGRDPARLFRLRPSFAWSVANSEGGATPSEAATLERVDWSDHRRLLEPIGNIPSAEVEARFYARTEDVARAVCLEQAGLRRNPGDLGSRMLAFSAGAFCCQQITYFR